MLWYYCNNIMIWVFFLSIKFNNRSSFEIIHSDTTSELISKEKKIIIKDTKMSKFSNRIIH